MKQIIKKFNVYRFDELSEKAQEKALYNLDLVGDSWYEDILNYWKEEFIKYGIEDVEFTFDLCYNTIGLAKATFNLGTMLEVFLPNYRFIHGLKNWFLDITSMHLYGDDKVSIETNIYGGHHSKIDKYMENVSCDINNILDDELYILLHKVLKDLQDEYDYLNSDTYKKEWLLNNELWFLEDGKVYQCV